VTALRVRVGKRRPLRDCRIGAFGFNVALTVGEVLLKDSRRLFGVWKVVAVPEIRVFDQLLNLGRVLIEQKLLLDRRIA